MKFGETLRQRSIPAWQTRKFVDCPRVYSYDNRCLKLQLTLPDNIDYEDIKHFIKENTTPGKGKAVCIPGSTNEGAQDFEQALYHILQEQTDRITWFVRSKIGEIQRRLDHLDQQIKRFAARKSGSTNRNVSYKRLERYGHIETDIIRVGEEIKSLARFVGVQQLSLIHI